MTINNIRMAIDAATEISLACQFYSGEPERGVVEDHYRRQD
jgi:hypothetical protein